MCLLNKSDADRIITTEEFKKLESIVEKQKLGIRCNPGSKYSSGAGYNLSTDDYTSPEAYGTALYASVCFSQDTIRSGIDQYFLLLMNNCALASGETYSYSQGNDTYKTLPKLHGIGTAAKVVGCWNMNDSAIKLARSVVEVILSQAG